MRTSFLPRLDDKDVMHHQYLYIPGTSNIEEIWQHMIRKSIKDSFQCTRSNIIDGNFGQMTKDQTLYRYYRPLQHVGNRGLN